MSPWKFLQCLLLVSFDHQYLDMSHFFYVPGPNFLHKLVISVFVVWNWYSTVWRPSVWPDLRHIQIEWIWWPSDESAINTYRKCWLTFWSEPRAEAHQSGLFSPLASNITAFWKMNKCCLNRYNILLLVWNFCIWVYQSPCTCLHLHLKMIQWLVLFWKHL